MTDIYIVRHGNTFDKGDVVTRVGARTDLPLSSSGEIQAAQLAVHLNQVAPGGFASAYCSPLLRTRQTAEAILGMSGAAPDLETLEFLREIDYGPDENQPEDAVISRLGEAALVEWDAAAVPPSEWDVDPVRLKQDWANLFTVVASDQCAGPVLVVTSNGIARFALDAINAFEIEPASIKLKTGAYGVIHAAANAVTLKSWNVRP